MKATNIALAKGRLENKAIKIFEGIGSDCSEFREKGRKLILHDKINNLDFILAKPLDVLTYVEHGVADIGIVGRDTLLEYSNQFYEMVDLKVGKCKLVVASVPECRLYEGYTRKTIATKYPEIARRYFREKGQDVEIIKMESSVELAPILGLADAIVDIVETGTTLQENGLSIIEEICDISAWVVVNKVSMKMKKNKIYKLINKIRNYVEEKSE